MLDSSGVTISIRGNTNDTNLVLHSSGGLVSDGANAADSGQVATNKSNIAANTIAIGSKAAQSDLDATDAKVLLNTTYREADAAGTLAATNAASITALQNRDPYLSSLLATPLIGQFREGTYASFGTPLNDGTRLVLEYYSALKNYEKMTRYVEHSYGAPHSDWEGPVGSYKEQSVLMAPNTTTLLGKTAAAGYSGTILMPCFTHTGVDSSNIYTSFTYEQEATFLLNNLALDASDTLCLLFWSMVFGPTASAAGGYNAMLPTITAAASRVRYYDPSSGLMTHDVSGSNASGPDVRVFQVAAHMNGVGWAMGPYNFSDAQTSPYTSLDTIKGLVDGGEKVTILAGIWGDSGEAYTFAGLKSRNLVDKTVCDIETLGSLAADASASDLSGLRQIQGAAYDSTSAFASFVNAKSATYDTTSSAFGMGMVQGITMVKLLDAAGPAVTKASLETAVKTLALTQAGIAADGFGSLVGADFSVGENTGLQLPASGFSMKTVNSSGNLVKI